MIKWKHVLVLFFKVERSPNRTNKWHVEINILLGANSYICFRGCKDSSTWLFLTAKKKLSTKKDTCTWKPTRTLCVLNFWSIQPTPHFLCVMGLFSHPHLEWLSSLYKYGLNKQIAHLNKEVDTLARSPGSRWGWCQGSRVPRREPGRRSPPVTQTTLCRAPTQSTPSVSATLCLTLLHDPAPTHLTFLFLLFCRQTSRGVPRAHEGRKVLGQAEK